MKPLSIYDSSFGDGCLGWTNDDVKHLLTLKRGFVYIPNTGDLKFIPVIRRTHLELIPVEDPEKSWNEYKANYKEPKVNEQRLDFIQKQRHEQYEDLGVHPLAHLNDLGMGYEWNGSEWVEFPQRGKLIIGDKVRIGAYTTVKRGTIDSTVIGDGCKIGSHCNIGHNTKLGKHCLLSNNVHIGGSCDIGSRVVFWQSCTVANKIKIGNNCVIGQGANVLKDVPDNTTVLGLWV